ncbi:MAG: hypothetical protein R6X19_07280 [Kiritimatiellia bacterium]
MKCRLCLPLLLATILATGCSTPLPKGFQTVPGPGWTTLEIRKDVNYDHAWNSVVELLARDFDLEILSKEDGYMRTAWSHTWNGAYLPLYRVRVTVLFPEDRQTIRIKPEAQTFSKDEVWVAGADERLLPGLKAELLGTIGRTLR